jgi:hypothetical protein
MARALGAVAVVAIVVPPRKLHFRGQFCEQAVHSWARPVLSKVPFVIALIWSLVIVPKVTCRPALPMKDHGSKTISFTIHIFPVKNNGFEEIQGLQITLGTGLLIRGLPI